MIDLQIAVAKAMGWKCHPDEYYIDKLAWTLNDDPQRWSTCDLPPLTLDLMFQAEEMLQGDERWKYAEELVGGGSYWRGVHTTAEQRARAWLKVKGVEL